MKLSDSEEKILLKIYDICFISLNEEVSIKSLYNILSKDYLYISIRSLQAKKLLTSYYSNKAKVVYLTSTGKRITHALALIRKIN